MREHSNELHLSRLDNGLAAGISNSTTLSLVGIRPVDTGSKLPGVFARYAIFFWTC